jgi:signal transduction histidine kinase
MLAGLEARAQAVLDSVRNIVRGIYPPLLADFGLANALRAHASAESSGSCNESFSWKDTVR